MKKPTKTQIMFIGVAAVAFYFWRKNKALASPAVIGDNALPIGAALADANAKSLANSALDAITQRLSQQKDIFNQDKAAYEALNPGHTYEVDFPGVKA